MKSTFLRKSAEVSAAALALAGCAVLTGCAFSGNGAGGAGQSSTAGGSGATSLVRGNVHGGQQPVSGSNVVLWAAGTSSGYGAGSTQIATTTTDANGNFNFSNASGVSPCTTGQYLYITANGGNAGAGNNSNLAMMAAIPTPCNATTGSLSVFVNEVSTVAAVTALQQFMSIGTAQQQTGAPWFIGAPSTNVTGLANAFMQVGNLVNLSTGVLTPQIVALGASNVTYTSSTTNAAGYTTYINPDYQKINGLADILSICINDTTGNNCTGSAGVLTMTSITSGSTVITPKDTIQAAYNMATLPNPQLNSTSTDSTGATVAKYWTNSSPSTTYLSTLWANIPATAPFQPYYSTAPNDTAINVTWRTANSSAATVATAYAASVAIDGFGDIWVGNGTGATTNLVNQFNPAGSLLQTVSSVTLPSYTLSFYPDSTTPTQAATTSTPYTLSYGRPYSLAIDTNNNAWFDSYNTSTGTVASLIGGLTAEIAQNGTTNAFMTGSSSGPLVFDSANNLFLADEPSASRYYISELPATPPANAAPSTAYQAVFEGIGRSTGIYNGIAMDSNNYAWGFIATAPTAGCTNVVIQRVNNAGMTTGESASTTNVTVPSQCPYQGAGDANGNMWATGINSTVAGSNSGNVAGTLMYINITCASCSAASPIVTVIPSGTGTTNGGLDGASGAAIDGSGNVWVANQASSTTGGVSEFSTSNNGSITTYTALSPAGTAVYGFGSSAGYSKVGGTVIDASGNVWLETQAGSYLNYLVGIASPVVTPLATAIANGKIGKKP